MIDSGFKILFSLKFILFQAKELGLEKKITVMQIIKKQPNPPNAAVHPINDDWMWPCKERGEDSI